MEKKSDFEKELTALKGRYYKENDSDTADFILAEYLFICLDNLNEATQHRDIKKILYTEQDKWEK